MKTGRVGFRGRSALSPGGFPETEGHLCTERNSLIAHASREASGTPATLPLLCAPAPRQPSTLQQAVLRPSFQGTYGSHSPEVTAFRAWAPGTPTSLMPTHSPWATCPSSHFVSTQAGMEEARTQLYQLAGSNALSHMRAVPHSKVGLAHSSERISTGGGD